MAVDGEERGRRRRRGEQSIVETGFDYLILWSKTRDTPETVSR